MTDQHEFHSSRYNFHVPVNDGVLLYNANTGAVLRFNGGDALPLAQFLSGRPVPVQAESLPAATWEQLWASGFIVSSNTDEVAEIRERFHRARGATPIVLTITTTLDCNLGCYYCYEERSADRLQIADVAAIVAIAEQRLSLSGKGGLHVDWYGGEPLMNLEFLVAASIALQTLCSRRQVRYSASIISNGTCWPDDVGSFVSLHKLRQVQISFDGLRHNHNRRRRYRMEHAPNGAASSFDTAIQLVDKLLEYVRVDIRLNIDGGNRADVGPFLNFARSRGWFHRQFPAVIQPARLSSYTDHSSFMRKSELSMEEYDAIREQVRNEIKSETLVEESEAPDGFPYPRGSVCAALANDSVVIGADGRSYRCGLQVSEPDRAVGGLSEAKTRSLPILGQADPFVSADVLWWQTFDPTTLPTCSRCSFLPICWGGCPKKHLDRDEHAITEQSVYWRRNLPRLVASGVGAAVSPAFIFNEADQFR